MDFLKKHYEKIILSVVLLGLAAAAALMPMQLSSERQRMEDQKAQLLQPSVKKLPPTDLSTNEMVLQRSKEATDIRLAQQHNVFNPVKWQRTRDGGLIKIQTGSEVGADAAEVTNITPLRLLVKLEEVGGTAENARYTVSITRETDKPPRPSRVFARLREKVRGFTILQVQGPAEDPQALVLLLDDEREPITVTKEKPYERVIGYAADMRYPPENLAWRDLRKGDTRTFADETYNIVAINQSEVVLSASSNQKQTVIPVKPNSSGNSSATK